MMMMIASVFFGVVSRREYLRVWVCTSPRGSDYGRIMTSVKTESVQWNEWMAMYLLRYCEVCDILLFYDTIKQRC